MYVFLFHSITQIFILLNLVSLVINDAIRHFVSMEGTLIIMATVLTDAGTYQAVIQNGAGQLAVNVSLSFLSPTSCYGGCYNNGTCVDLSVCLCPLNYTGARCDEYVGTYRSTMYT